MNRSFLIVGFLCGSAAAQQSLMSPPMSVGIVLDTSGSMGRKMGQSKQLVAEVIKTGQAQDEFFVIQFGDRPVLVKSFGASTGDIENRLSFLQSKGRSAMFDAIDLALHEMKKAANPSKALLVISDGGDNNSQSTAEGIRTLLREAGVRVYAIGIYEPLPFRTRTAEEVSGPGQLSEIAERSGGRHFDVASPAELPSTIAQLRTALRAPRQ